MVFNSIALCNRGAVEKPKMFDKDTEITHEAVVKKLHEIMAARGKKRTNRKEQIELLMELYNVSPFFIRGIFGLTKFNCDVLDLMT